MINFVKIEEQCIVQLNIDYVPLHDIVREFSGFDKAPTEADFLIALNFLEYLIIKYRLKCLIGPDLADFDKPVSELIAWLKNKWYSNEYEDINYAVWLEKQ